MKEWVVMHGFLSRVCMLVIDERGRSRLKKKGGGLWVSVLRLFVSRGWSEGGMLMLLVTVVGDAVGSILLL